MDPASPSGDFSSLNILTIKVTLVDNGGTILKYEHAQNINVIIAEIVQLMLLSVLISYQPDIYDYSIHV